MITVDVIPAIRRGLSTLQNDSRALREVAERLIAKSAWWYEHPQGKVRAPKHCERISAGSNGLELSFGANRFLVGQAILECASRLDAFLGAIAGTASSDAHLSPFEIKKWLRGIIKPTLRQCVVHLNGVNYQYYGDADDDFMHFGTQAINVSEFIEEFLIVCELRAIWAE